MSSQWIRTQQRVRQLKMTERRGTHTVLAAPPANSPCWFRLRTHGFIPRRYPERQCRRQRRRSAPTGHHASPGVCHSSSARTWSLFHGVVFSVLCCVQQDSDVLHVLEYTRKSCVCCIPLATHWHPILYQPAALWMRLTVVKAVVPLHRHEVTLRQ